MGPRDPAFTVGITTCSQGVGGWPCQVSRPVPPTQCTVPRQALRATLPTGHPTSQEMQRTTAGRHLPAPQSPPLLGAGWRLHPQQPSQWQKNLHPPRWEPEARADCDLWELRSRGGQAARPCGDGRWQAPGPWWLWLLMPGGWLGAAWSHWVGGWPPSPGR